MAFNIFATATSDIPLANLDANFTLIGTASAASILYPTATTSITYGTTGTGHIFAGALVGPASATVFNTVSTTVNAFGAATTLNIGSASTTAGTVYLPTVNSGILTATGSVSSATGAAIKGVNTSTGGAAIAGLFTLPASATGTVLVGQSIASGSGYYLLALQSGNGSIITTNQFLVDGAGNTTIAGAATVGTTLGVTGTSTLAAVNASGQLTAVTSQFTSGADSINNGGFSSSANWVLGANWSIGAGVATAATASSFIYQSNTGNAAKVYALTYTVTAYTSGTIQPWENARGGFGAIAVATGTYTALVTGAAWSNLGFSAGAFVGSIDNVSLKEVSVYANGSAFIAEALSVAGTTTLTATSSTLGLQIYSTGAGATDPFIRCGTNSAYGWQWTQDESSTGDMYIQRRLASVNTTVLSMSRSTGAVTIPGTLEVSSTLTLNSSSTNSTMLINRANISANGMTKFQTASVDKWIFGLRNTSDDDLHFYSYVASADVALLSSTGLTVTGTGKVSTGFAVGNATPGAGGVAFPATAVAVADANTLDDYEEGTWTPTLTPSTSGTITLGSPNACGYTKIGRLVTVNGLIDTASVSSPIGASVTFNNLPFASNATGTQRSAGTAIGFALSSGTVIGASSIVSSTTSFVVFINASLFQPGSQVYFQLTYTV